MKKKKDDRLAEEIAVEQAFSLRWVEELSSRLVDAMAGAETVTFDFEREILRQWRIYKKTPAFRATARKAMLSWLDHDFKQGSFWDQMMNEDTWQELKEETGRAIAGLMEKRIKKALK